MTTGKTTNIKSLLRDECLPALNQSAAYFSMADVRAWLQQRGVACPPPVLRDYLSQFMRSRLIHDAGRGWYSDIASPSVLNAKPVARLARQVEQAFPLLDFTCWSTEQVRSFGHLLLARFVAFIHTERDAMVSVAGCYWHGCPKHCRMPKSNVAFWRRKIARNKKRDLLVRLTLRKASWRILRIWEHDLSKRPAITIRKIAAALKSPA
jgi:hypothetical protein